MASNSSLLVFCYDERAKLPKVRYLLNADSLSDALNKWEKFTRRHRDELCNEAVGPLGGVMYRFGFMFTKGALTTVRMP